MAQNLGVKRPIVIIGGTGFADRLGGKPDRIETPFGAASVLISSENDGRTVYAIKRHGDGHSMPPHRINYWANLRAAKEVGAEAIFASAAVGVIQRFEPGDIVLGKDIFALNATLEGRPVTFHHDFTGGVVHADMSNPFDRKLNDLLFASAASSSLGVKDGAIIGVGLGPRYETATEINFLRACRVDLIGMTTAHEAVLARELEIPYAVCCIGANWAAGITTATLAHDEVIHVVEQRSGDLLKILKGAIARIG